MGKYTYILNADTICTEWALHSQINSFINQTVSDIQRVLIKYKPYNHITNSKL